MGHIPINHIGRRWALTTGAGMILPIAPMFFNGVSWPVAAALSAAGMLSSSLITMARFILPEILQHLLQVRRLRDQHTEAMLRECNQHTEVMQLLAKVIDTDTFDVDVARVVERIRVLSSSIAAQSPNDVDRRIDQLRTAVNVEPMSVLSRDRRPSPARIGTDVSRRRQAAR